MDVHSYSKIYGGLIMSRFRFRGKDVNSGEWVYGHLNLSYKASFIGDEDAYYINGREIDPNTIGQYVGLKDVNDKDLYEDDLLYIDEEMPCAEVIWSEKHHGFVILWHDKDIHNVRIDPLYCFDRWPIQIIGTIHDKDIQQKVQNIKYGTKNR